MPSLNVFRNVRYSQSDLDALDKAITVLRFMAEFANDRKIDYATIGTGLFHVREYIAAERAPKKPSQTAAT